MAAAAEPHRDARVGHVELQPVETFSTMFRREYPGLVTLAWALTGSRETAEDVAQEAMLALYRRWDSISSIDNPRAYLRRICVYKATSWVRRRAAEARALNRVASQPAAAQRLPEDAEQFWTQVRRLPRRQAQVIALFYGCDLSVEQVGETLGLAAGSVKSHLSRGRRALSQRLGAAANAEDEVTR